MGLGFYGFGVFRGLGLQGLKGLRGLGLLSGILLEFLSGPLFDWGSIGLLQEGFVPLGLGFP